MARPARVEVCGTWTDDEVDGTATCLVTAGTPDRGPDMNCAGGYPGDPPEVEILSVVADDDGRDLSGLLSQREMNRIEESALDEAIQTEREAEELRADDARDCARERHWYLAGAFED